MRRPVCISRCLINQRLPYLGGRLAKNTDVQIGQTMLQFWAATISRLHCLSNPAFPSEPSAHNLGSQRPCLERSPLRTRVSIPVFVKEKVKSLFRYRRCEVSTDLMKLFCCNRERVLAAGISALKPRQADLIRWHQNM